MEFLVLMNRSWQFGSMASRAESGNCIRSLLAMFIIFRSPINREAAYAMISYIHPPDTLEFDPPFFDAIPCLAQCSIIELGSGSGLVASVVARMLQSGKDIFIASDLPEVWTISAIPELLIADFSKVCSLLEQNLKELPVVVVKSLSWGNRNDAIHLCSAFLGKEHSASSCRNLTHIICSDLVMFIHQLLCRPSDSLPDIFPGSICSSSAHSA